MEDFLRIGATIDGDTSYMQTVNFNGDDLSQTSKTGDEDGLSQAMKDALPGLWYGQTGSYTINNIPVKNTTANTAVLRGWIDFNHNGTFDSNESAEANVAINATTASLTWTIPATVTSGPAIIRLRLSTDASLLTANTAGASAAYIPMFDGEAEDHQISKISVTGNIFSDKNGNGVLDAGENNTGALTLFAYLLKDGLIVDSAHVRNDGTYSFANVAQNMSTATIAIGTNSVSPGSASTVINNVQNATNTPTGWMYTGESSGNTADGSNGILTISAGLTSINQQNFGLNQLPVSDDKSEIIAMPVGGTIPAGSATQSVSGNDAEDGVLGNTNTIKITTLPSNATMYYNGIAVNLNQQITNFNPALISYAAVANGSIAVTFQYTFLDAANAEDATPASYTLNWLSALPVTLESFSVNKETCNNLRINWSVSNAINFKAFELQQSQNGVGFQTLQVINYSAGKVNYSYTDIPAAANRYYYRLKLIDEDGSFTFSAVITASVDCNTSTMKAYPNPVSKQLTITGIEANSLIRIFNNNGLLVQTQKAISTQTDINFSALQAGIYYVHISNTKGMVLNTFTIRKK